MTKISRNVFSVEERLTVTIRQVKKKANCKLTVCSDTDNTDRATWECTCFLPPFPDGAGNVHLYFQNHTFISYGQVCKSPFRQCVVILSI